MRFWPCCRQDVIDWIKECVNYILTDKSVRCHSEGIFSWRVTAPVFVLHCDFWSPGSIIAELGATHLLSAMCDLTQFVVSVPVTDIHAHKLARLLFQEILLKVGMCGLTVVSSTPVSPFVASLPMPAHSLVYVFSPLLA